MSTDSGVKPEVSLTDRRISENTNRISDIASDIKKIINCLSAQENKLTELEELYKTMHKEWEDWNK